MASNSRIAGLDGLRGLAILSVLVHHVVVIVPSTPGLAALYLLVQAGWVGVDLFFVLSGFLITLVLLRFRDQPRFAATFYGRRILRIFPVYFGFLSLVGVVQLLAYATGFYVEGLPAPEATIVDLPWHFTFLTNVLIASRGSFLASLNHFWTLAVEEQFYLFWPWLIFFVPRSRLALTCLGVAALSSVARYALADGPIWATVLTPFRLDGFALGGLVAMLYATGFDRARLRILSAGAFLVSSAGVLLVAYRAGALYATDLIVQQFGFLFLATSFASAIAYVVSSDGWVVAILQNRVLRGLGTISFALYVFHFPVQAVLQATLPATNAVASALFSAGVSIALATLSHYFFESKFRTTGSAWTNPAAG